jgi:hypothetical protein
MGSERIKTPPDSSPSRASSKRVPHFRSRTRRGEETLAFAKYRIFEFQTNTWWFPDIHLQRSLRIARRFCKVFIVIFGGAPAHRQKRKSK